MEDHQNNHHNHPNHSISSLQLEPIPSSKSHHLVLSPDPHKNPSFLSSSSSPSNSIELNLRSFLLPPPRSSSSSSSSSSCHKTRWFLASASLVVALYTFYALWSSHHHSTFPLLSSSPHSPSASPFALLNPNQLPPVLSPQATLCDYCDCNANRSSPPLLPIIPADQPPLGTPFALSFKIWTSARDTYCHHAYLGEGSALDLLIRTDLTRDLRSTLQYNLSPLSLSLPTAYLYTKTSAAGRTGHLREAYFKRHVLTIRTHIALMKERPWPVNGSQARWGPTRQLLWLVIEDAETLSSNVANLLATSGLPYIYVVFGPTHHYGNAQQNAAYAIIRHLSDPETGILGHGPVLSIDDDSNFLPSLLEIIWRVQRIGIWPMGNLGPNGWEGPVYDDQHKLVKWEAGAVEHRKFPIDNGAFCFNSDLLGSVLKGPRYWPSDFSGGENEFIELIVKTKEEIEPLCYNW